MTVALTLSCRRLLAAVFVTSMVLDSLYSVSRIRCSIGRAAEVSGPSLKCIWEVDAFRGRSLHVVLWAELATSILSIR
jgi:hypothetical protein